MNGLQMMPTDSKQVLNRTLDREKTLCMFYRFEPSHLAFFLTRWLMQDFSPVVFVLTGAMHNGRKDLPMCCRITPQLVGDQLPGCSSLLFQGLTKEAFSGATISALGDQNIDYVSILIDGSPQIEVLALDGDEEFIDMPEIAEPTLFLPQLACIGRTKLQTPIPNCLLRNKDASLSKQILDVSKAQREPMV